MGERERRFYSGSIGNLLLLSKSINSSLQNNSFEDKKNPKTNSSGEKIRNESYSDGSHSEIEVSRKDKWDPAAIEEREVKLLTFMEQRWKFEFKNEGIKKNIHFLKNISKLLKEV